MFRISGSYSESVTKTAQRADIHGLNALLCKHDRQVAQSSAAFCAAESLGLPPI